MSGTPSSIGAGQAQPIRCPTPGCNKFLAEAGAVTVGWIRLKCPRCKQHVIVTAPDSASDKLKAA